MKKKIALFAASLMFLCACAADTSEVATVTEEPVSEQENVVFLSTVYPDGTEYISTDNGETWFVDGVQSEAPVVYFTAHSDNIYDRKNKLYVVAHANGDSFNYGGEYGLYDFTNEECGLLYDYPYSQVAYLLMDGGAKPFLIYDPQLAENPSAGNYRYIKEFGDYEFPYICGYNFYME